MWTRTQLGAPRSELVRYYGTLGRTVIKSKLITPTLRAKVGVFLLKKVITSQIKAFIGGQTWQQGKK